MEACEGGGGAPDRHHEREELGQSLQGAIANEAQLENVEALGAPCRASPKPLDCGLDFMSTELR